MVTFYFLESSLIYKRTSKRKKVIMNPNNTIYIVKNNTLRIMWWSGVFGLIAYSAKCNRDVEIERSKNFKDSCLICNYNNQHKTDECVFGDDKPKN